MRLLVATSNRHKLAEIAAALTGVSVVGLDAYPPLPAPVEDGETFLENARIKALRTAEALLALAGAERSDLPDWVLADDSGLCVEALGGAPGVRSARYAGEGAGDAANNAKLLEALRSVEEGARGAEFVCALALVSLPGKTQAFEVEGKVRGQMLRAPRGTGGFGYDPLFLVPSLGRAFAELTPAEKAAHSHRGRALEALRVRLGELLAAASPSRPPFSPRGRP